MPYFAPCVFVIPDEVRAVASPDGSCDECFFGVRARVPRVFQRPDVRLEGSRPISDEGIGVSAAATGDINNVRRLAVLISRVAENQQELPIVGDAKFRCHQIQRRRYCILSTGFGDVLATSEVRLVRCGIRDEQDALGGEVILGSIWNFHERFIRFLVIGNDADFPVFEWHGFTCDVPEFNPVICIVGAVADFIEDERGAPYAGCCDSGRAAATAATAASTTAAST